MAASTYFAQVQQLYIAYFGRPADTIGQAYWANQIDAANGSIASVIAGFSASAESAALFGNKSSIDKVTAIYQNAFGRAPEPAGLAYWVAQLDSGKVSQAQASWTIQQSAGAGDAAAVQNKLTAAQAFTAQIDTTAEITGYQGAAAAESARAFLKTVTADNATATAAVTGAAAAVVAATAVGVVGATYTLTTGVDTFTGGVGVDTFTASVDTTAGTTSNTLSAADKINGGAGLDTLNLTVVAAGPVANATNGADISNIETINVRALNTGLTTLNAATTPGVTTVVSDRSTGNLTVTNLAAGATAGLKGNGVVSVGTLTAGYVDGATAANITVSGGNILGAGTISVNGIGLTSATITSTGTANAVAGVAFTNGAVKAVTVDAQSNVNTGNITGLVAASTITVKGDGTANIGTLQAGNVTVLDASANLGGVTAVLNDVATLVATGGAGNDVFTTGAVLATGANVNAGAGTADRLVISDSTHLTAAAGAFYKGFEQVQVANGVSADVSLLAANNTIGTVIIADGATADATAVTGLTAAQAGNVQITSADSVLAAITIGLTGAANAGQIDTVKAALTTSTAAGAQNAIDLTGLTLTGVEKLELTGNGTTAANSGAVTLTTENATSLDSIILKSAGVNSITIAVGQTSTNLVVDASGSTGNTTINASAYASSTGATLKGGSGADTITGSVKADVLTGGAGNDTFAFGVAGSVIGAAQDVITDFQAKTATAGDILTFGVGTVLLAADATALVAGVNVQQSAGGKITFAAADNTLALKIAAVQADTQLKADNAVAFFEDSGNTYVFNAGVGATAGDEQLIQLTGVTGLTTLVGGATTTIAA